MQQHGSPLCVAYVTSPVSRWFDVQGNIDLAGLIDNTDKGPVIKLTAYSRQGRCMTIQEISNMSFEELAAVHTVTPLCCIGFARLSSIYINMCVQGMPYLSIPTVTRGFTAPAATTAWPDRSHL